MGLWWWYDGDGSDSSNDGYDGSVGDDDVGGDGSGGGDNGGDGGGDDSDNVGGNNVGGDDSGTMVDFDFIYFLHYPDCEVCCEIHHNVSDRVHRIR